jgi:hypothetical protein
MRRRRVIYLVILAALTVCVLIAHNDHEDKRIKSIAHKLNNQFVTDPRFEHVRVRGGRGGLLFATDWFEVFGYVASSNQLVELKPTVQELYPFDHVRWHVFVRE